MTNRQIRHKALEHIRKNLKYKSFLTAVKISYWVEKGLSFSEAKKKLPTWAQQQACYLLKKYAFYKHYTIKGGLNG